LHTFFPPDEKSTTGCFFSQVRVLQTEINPVPVPGFWFPGPSCTRNLAVTSWLNSFGGEKRLGAALRAVPCYRHDVPEHAFSHILHVTQYRGCHTFPPSDPFLRFMAMDRQELRALPPRSEPPLISYATRRDHEFRRGRLFSGFPSNLRLSMAANDSHARDVARRYAQHTRHFPSYDGAAFMPFFPVGFGPHGFCPGLFLRKAFNFVKGYVPKPLRQWCLPLTPASDVVAAVNLCIDD